MYTWHSNVRATHRRFMSQPTSWMLSARDVILLALGMCCALALAAGSALYGLHAEKQIRNATQVVQRADSLTSDWAVRKCVPNAK